MTPPLSAFHRQTRSRNLARPMSRRPGSCRSINCRSTTIWGAVPAWSVPGRHHHVAPAHSLETAENVLQRVVQRVAHMQRAGHVRRRDHDGEGFCVLALGASGPERAAVLPDPGHPAFDIGRLVILLDHDNAIGAMGTARKPPDGTESTAPVRRKRDKSRLGWLNEGYRPRETRSISALTMRSTNPGRLSSSQDFSIGRSISLTRSSSVRALLLRTVLASEFDGGPSGETSEDDKI